MTSDSHNKNLPIVFFDGLCGLCNSFISFLFYIDTKNYFRVATLQGKTGKSLLAEEYSKNLTTIILYENGEIYKESTAVLKTFSKLGGPWYFLSLFIFLPKPLRDIIYRTIAKNRYKIFGKKETCRIPTIEEKQIFLD